MSDSPMSCRSAAGAVSLFNGPQKIIFPIRSSLGGRPSNRP